MNNFKVLFTFQTEKGSNFGSIVVKEKDIRNAYDRAMYIICTSFSEEYSYNIIEISLI